MLQYLFLKEEGITVHFTQREQDKLMIVVAAEVARVDVKHVA